MHFLLEVDCWVFFLLLLFVCFLKTKIIVLHGRTTSHGSGSHSVDMLSVGLQWHSIQSHSFLYLQADVPTSRNFQTHSVQVRPCTTERMPRSKCSRKDLPWPTELVKAGRSEFKSTVIRIPSYYCGAIIAEASRKHHYLPDAESLVWTPPPLLSSVQVF